MPHCIEAFIADRGLLSRATRDLEDPRIEPLPFDLGLVLATLPLRWAIGRTKLLAPALFEHIPWLSAEEAEWARGVSREGVIAYIETDYWGGSGSQAAIVWQGGSIALGPLPNPDATLEGEVPCREGMSYPERLQNDPINRALRFVGVKAAPRRDEFDTVNLGDIRDMGEDGWPLR
ncbi:MAG: hypothetical protein V2A79_03310 [Planctomycetota bacterium]